MGKPSSLENMKTTFSKKDQGSSPLQINWLDNNSPFLMYQEILSLNYQFSTQVENNLLSKKASTLYK